MDEIIALEDRRIEAMTKGDVQTLEEIIADALYKLSFLLGCKEATDTMVADLVFETVQRRWDLYRNDCNRARFADVNL